MTLEQLEKRIEAMEAEIKELKTRLAEREPKPDSWLGVFGMFQDDPTFDEAMRLGREYRDQVNRESLEEMDREEQEAEARKKSPPRKPKTRNSNVRT